MEANAHPDSVPQETVRLEGVVAPGFVELQINGAFGKDVAVDDDALEVLAAQLPRFGVTSFLPTLVSSAPERYEWLLERFAAFQQRSTVGTPGSHALGLHLEGPFLSPHRAGAHRREHLRTVDLQWVSSLLAKQPGAVRLMTLAPELHGSPSLVASLFANGVRTSAGHTETSALEMRAAIAGGLGMVTHASNAMQKSLDDGPLAEVLRQRLPSGVILDGLHVRDALAVSIFAALGPQRLFLVTDAAPCAGMPDGRYTLGDVEVDKVGLRVTVAGQPETLAGSALTMDEAVRHAMRVLDVSLATAVQMASQTPADALGEKGRGRLSTGAPADFVVLDEPTVSVRETYVGGRRVFAAS